MITTPTEINAAIFTYHICRAIRFSPAQKMHVPVQSAAPSKFYRYCRILDALNTARSIITTGGDAYISDAENKPASPMKYTA